MRLTLLFVGILTAGSLLVTSAAQAQATAGSNTTPTASKMMQPHDCSKVKEPARCEARNKAIEMCKNETDKRACMKRSMPANTPRDCSKSHNPARCEARQKAWEACRDKQRGAERKQCMKDHMGTAKPPKGA